MIKKLLFLAIAPLFMTNAFSQTCPTCVVDPSVHTSTASDDFAFVPDEVTITRGEDTCAVLQYLMPLEFDASAESGGVIGLLNIFTIEVLSVTGLPNGLSFSCNEPSCFYDLSVSRFGCVSFGGNTLAAPGTYTVNVTVQACTDLNPALANPCQSLAIPLTVNVVASADGNIQADNTLGCDSVKTTFFTDLSFPPNPSQYSWDVDGDGVFEIQGDFVDTTVFGLVNNQITEHEVYLKTELLNYVITNVSFNASNQSLWEDGFAQGEDCIPIFGNCLPDVYATIFDNNGVQIGSLGTIDDNQSPSWGGLSFVLPEPTFQISFFDEDPPIVGSDDFLGAPTITANQSLSVSGSVNGQSYSVQYTTVVAETFLDTVTITVYPPSEPVVVESVNGNDLFCAGDSLELTAVSATAETYEWFKDSIKIDGFTTQNIFVTEAGSYYVEVVDVNNICATSSTAFEVGIEEVIPSNIQISESGEDLYVENPNGYQVQWFTNATGTPVPIPGGDTDTITNVSLSNSPFTVEFTSPLGCIALSNPFEVCVSGTTSSDGTELDLSTPIVFTHEDFVLIAGNTVAWAVSTTSDGPIEDIAGLQSAIDAGWVFPGSSGSDLNLSCSNLPDGVEAGEYYMTPFTAEVFSTDPFVVDTNENCIPDANLCLEITGTDFGILANSLTFTLPDGVTVGVIATLIPPDFPVELPDTLTPDLLALLPSFLPEGLCFQLTDLYDGDINGTWSLSAENVGTGPVNVELFPIEITVDADSCGLIEENQFGIVPGQSASIPGGSSNTISFVVPPTPEDFPTIQPNCNVFGEAVAFSINCPTSVDEIEYASNFNLYPNPNNGSFNIVFDVLERSEVLIQIYDVMGRNILQRTYQTMQGKFNEKIELRNNLSAGFYIFNVKVGSTSIQKHFIVE